MTRASQAVRVEGEAIDLASFRIGEEDPSDAGDDEEEEEDGGDQRPPRVPVEPVAGALEVCADTVVLDREYTLKHEAGVHATLYMRTCICRRSGWVSVPGYVWMAISLLYTGCRL